MAPSLELVPSKECLHISSQQIKEQPWVYIGTEELYGLAFFSIQHEALLKKPFRGSARETEASGNEQMANSERNRNRGDKCLDEAASKDRRRKRLSA